MPTSDSNAIAAHCAGLVMAFQRLTTDLVIPQIDQELYTDLFLHPMQEQQCHDDDDDSTSRVVSASSPPAVSAADLQAEALIALGGSELIVAALQTHEQLTLQVMQAVALRESVVARMWACCDAYDERYAATAEEARFTLLRLLQEHQLVTLLVVESIFEWREVLTRPYPFLMRNGENYFMTIAADCAAFDSQALVRSIASIRLRLDPLCAKVDLKRLLHRLETKRRSRLITTGAMWNVGLQPLQPLPARRRSTSAVPRRAASASGKARGGGDAAAATPTAARSSVARRSAPTLVMPAVPPSHGGRRFSQLFEGSPEDFAQAVVRLSAQLGRHSRDREAMTSQLSASAGSAASLPSTAAGAGSRRRVSAPHPPLFARRHRSGSCGRPGGGAAAAEEERQKQQRLLAAARVMEAEPAVQRRVVEQLYELAYEQQRFVPLLDISQLFNEAQGGAGLGAREYPPESWPLDRSQWRAVAAAEGRVDRLGCMSTAREALRSADLLGAWQRRMGRRASDLSGLEGSHTSVNGSGWSPKAGAGGGHRTSHKPAPPAAGAGGRRRGSVASHGTDSPAHTSTASASFTPAVADSRLPVKVPSAASSLRSSSMTSSTDSATSMSDSAHHGGDVRRAVQSAQEKPEDSEAFSSDFESDTSSEQAGGGSDKNSEHNHDDDDNDDDGRGNHGSAAPSAAFAADSPNAAVAKPSASRSSSSSSSSSSFSSSSSAAMASHRPSLDELREQLLAEHRINSRSQSYTQE